MSVFVVGQIEVTDPGTFSEYLEKFFPILKRHNGILLAGAKSETVLIEGEWALPKTVVMQFPTKKAAESWHNDPEYQTIIPIRLSSSKANLVLVEGVD